MKTNPGTFAEVLRKRHFPFPLSPGVVVGTCGCFFCAQEGKACLSKANPESGIKTQLQHQLSTWIQLCLKLVSYEHKYPFDLFVFDS